ncbi:MAG: hypothetical protein WCK74_02830 [Gemmatimonadaceae bacterium]
MTDIDAILLDSFTTSDGVLGLIGIDDDRPMAAWSAPHHERALLMQGIAQARVEAATWRLADVQGRQGTAEMVAGAQASLADAEAQVSAWTAQRERLEAARAAL